jgi:hypothetical protein
VCLILAGSGQAEVIFSDSFENVDAWESNVVLSSGTLSYGILGGSGGKAEVISNWNTNAEYSGTDLRVDGAVQYTRLLVNLNGNTSTNANNNKFMIFSSASDDGPGVAWDSQTENDVTTHTAQAWLQGSGGDSVVISNTETFLVVMRSTWADAAGGDKLELWINPADTSALGAADSVVTGDFADTKDQFYPRMQGMGNWYFDELAMGTNADDIAIPEPATMTLLGLGGLVALRRRRRA